MSSIAVAHRLLARPRSGALVDVVVAAGVFVGAVVLLAHGGAPGGGARDLDAAGVGLAAATAVPLLWWRRAPLAVFALTAAACTALAALDYSIGLTLGPTAALYLLATRRETRGWWRAAVVVGTFVAYTAAFAAARGSFPAAAVLHTGIAWAGAWFAGERTRLRREQVADLRDRATRAQHDAERERALAVAEERARIARDLHDSAAHAISVIAVRAGAARLRHAREPERTLAALQAVEDLARQTVDQLDQLVGTLRDPDRPDGAVPPPAGLASLDTLVAHHHAAGLPVTVEVDGTPRPLGGAADQAAYRILQEALTNAARHGAGAARVALTYTDAAVDLTVTNPTNGADPLARLGAAEWTGTPGHGTGRAGGGHGLIGMRERATLAGGTIHTGQSGEVFEVRARIPFPGQRP
jgi:signal transduction histidine kinase